MHYCRHVMIAALVLLTAGVANTGSAADDVPAKQNKEDKAGKAGNEGTEKKPGKDNKDNKEGKRTGGGGKPGRESAVAAVKTLKIASTVTPVELTLVSTLTGRSQADVYPKVSGRVSSLGPKENERVKVGQLLLKIDRNDPGETYLTTPVVSPIEGWVGRWFITSIGEQVTPQGPVVTIVDDGALRASLNLPVDSWLLINDQTAVTITVGTETRPAKIRTVSRTADSETSRGSVIVEVDNAGHEWRAGMVGRVTMGLDPRMRITIPSTALTITDAGAFVYVAEADKARRIKVAYRMLSSDKIEITEGLSDGSSVVVLGINQLSDGATIRVVEDKI